MKETERRRRSSRHPLRWEAAVVFDKAQGKPVVHTQTQDLSEVGAAIFSDHADLTGSIVNLLLAQPPRKGGEEPKVLKLKARVISTARTPQMSQYRHGLSFIRYAGDGAEILAKTLASLTAETPRGGSGAAAKTTMPSVVSGGDRLAQLKQLAQAKLARREGIDPQAEINMRVNDALARVHRYLKELVEQLNIVRPAYPRGYAIAGVPEFSALAWKEGRADFDKREAAPEVKLYEKVSLRFRLSGDKQIEVAREFPASEKLRQLLGDCDIAFRTHDVRNDRGTIQRTLFYCPCEVMASLVLLGNFGTGKLLLRARNVSGFGALEQILAPEAIDDASLDELTGFILGETSHPGSLLLRNA
ncbi:MAG: PilZ domain-containing protein [Burkholderiales bacterium]|nr:PilZ domain-containing protein [Burkholderiales bacterium]